VRIAILFPGDLESISTGGIDRYVKSVILHAGESEITVFGVAGNMRLDLNTEYDRSYLNHKYKFVAITDGKHRPYTLYYSIALNKWKDKLKEYDWIFSQRIEFMVNFWRKKPTKIAQIIHGSGKYYEYSYGKLRFWMYSLIERVSVSVADKTFVIMNNNKYGVPHYRKLYPKYAERFYFAINPVDTSMFRNIDKRVARNALDLDSNANIVLYAGRLKDNPKRIFLLPEICQELNERNLSTLFLVVGSGEDEQILKNKVSAAGLEKYFKFIGFINSSKELALYNQAADVTINISMYEGTCTSNIESVASGTPVVSTDVGEIRELIKNGKNGVIVNNYPETIVSAASDGIAYVLTHHIEMDNSYLMYEGKYAISKLIDDLQN